LNDSINAADLAGKKDLERLAGEDEELSEELAGMQANFGNDTSQASREPRPSFSSARSRLRIAARQWRMHFRRPRRGQKRQPRPPA